MADTVYAKTDVLIVGGGTGGCAAAMAVASMGYGVIMTEVTDWIGGQLTAQAVPPDEHPWIERFGCTRRYRRYRDGVRQYYRDHYPLSAAARADRALNPGQGNVSRLCHEFRVGLSVLENMLAYYRSIGMVQVLLEREPVAVEMDGDRARAVTLRDLRTGQEQVIEADYVLDATELGDLLPLADVEYVSGAESQSETGEMHALAGAANPEDVQSIAWCFPMGYDPDGEHVIEKPAQYDFWRDYEPQLTPAWPGKLLSWSQCDPVSLELRQRVLFPEEETKRGQSLWLFRRIATTQHYPAGVRPHEVTLVNWPQLDYWEGNIIDKPADEVATCLEGARQLAFSLFYWMQTEAPRPDGGVGYPGLYLCPEMVGTDDGLAKYPYIRESRRIRALFTVTEQHVGTEMRGGMPAERFADSVGVGSYRIDLHPSTAHINYIDISSLPFQIPLGALIPVRVENLLPACKNLGVTHITNGCYRLHPVEWNIGESAGLLAAFCLREGVPPRAVRERPELLSAFQDLLVAQGVELDWPTLRPR